MQKFGSIENSLLILLLVVPGLIIVFVKSTFVTGRRASHTSTILSYFVVSCVYYGIVLPFVDIPWLVSLVGSSAFFTWFCLVFVGPAAFGLALGVDVQKNFLRKLIQRLGLNPVHVMPTAWDWKFGEMGSEWVLVTLKNGTQFAGLFGNQSFAASDPAERDIYIQWVYDIDEEENWISRGETAILVTANEVSTIEFWPYLETVENNE